MKRIIKNVIRQILDYTEINSKVLESQIEQIILECNKNLAPYSNYKIFDVIWSEHSVHFKNTIFSTTSSDVIKALADCSQVAITICSLGEKVDLKIQEIKLQNPLDEIIYDRVYSALLEQKNTELYRQIENLARSEGLQLTAPLIAGFGDFSINHISILLKCIGASRENISWSINNGFTPKKTTISVLGLSRSELTLDKPFEENEFTNHYELKSYTKEE